MTEQKMRRGPGRPRAIPEDQIPHVISLYNQGFGYRAVARELRQAGISVNWSTVRRLIKSKVGYPLPSQ